MMMDKLLEYASSIGVRTVCGNLSLTDIGHKNRLHAFYKKHGFEIIEFEASEGLFYGKTQKQLAGN